MLSVEVKEKKEDRAIMGHWYSGKTCRLSIMLSMTFGYFLVEIVYGYITNSMALVADSFHMLSDVLALIVAFFCMKVSSRRCAKNFFLFSNNFCFL